MNRQNLTSLIAILFVVSGALGLMYQIVWFKYLSLFLGNTTYAQTIVLATFMGGLAIGAALWGRVADRTKNAFVLYGILESLIGFYCLFYPFIIDIQKSLIIEIVHRLNLASDGVGVMGLKLLISLVSLLPPTILMGGTLPLLVRYLSRRIEESGSNVATLYFLNSFGAVAGSLLGGFFFIRLIGLSATVVSAATVNVLIGGLAIWFGRMKPIEEVEAVSTTEWVAREFSQPQIVGAIVVAGVSGLAAMVYEVAWVRLLIPILGSSTYSFTLMLVAFIGGITIGSLIAARQIDRTKNLLSLLQWCQIGVVISMIATFPLYGRLPYIFWRIGAMLVRTSETYPLYLAIQLLFGFVLMVVPTVFLGISLPVATRIAARGLNTLGKSVGNIFSINTLGTVAGSLLAGLVLIPLVGVYSTLKIGVACNGVAVFVLLAVNTTVTVRNNGLIALALIVVFAISTVVTPDIERNVMLSGVFRQISRNNTPPTSYAEFAEKAKNIPVRYFREGVTATVGVIQADAGDGTTQNVLIINGKADASSRGDLPTQVLLGQLPLILHPDAKRALVIGYGSGVTAGSILTHPVERVDCVEISPEVIEASEWFSDVNRLPLSDPRMKLHIEDALAYLKLTEDRYDVIVSEPSNPWIAGIGNLYSQDFFELCKQRMPPNGLMVQWFHLYEMDDEILQIVLRTFAQSFKSVSIWQSLGADIILIGSQATVEISDSLLAGHFRNAVVAADLKRIAVRDEATLLSLQMLTDKSVREYLEDGFLNTEDCPRLEYEAPRAFFVNRGVAELYKHDDRTKLFESRQLLSRRIAARPLSAEEAKNIGLYHSAVNRGNGTLGYAMLTEYIRQRPKDGRMMEALADLSERMKRVEVAMEIRKRLTELEPHNLDNLERYAWTRYAYDRTISNGFLPASFEEPRRLMLECVKQSKDTVDRFRARMGDMYFGSQQYQKAADQYARALQIREVYEPTQFLLQDVILLQLARSLQYVGKRDLAAGFALQATRFNPRNEGAKDFLYAIMTGTK
jgi:spermidine synthase/MFS family permease